jgi:hypothetical protein
LGGDDFASRETEAGMKQADIHEGEWYTKDGLFARQVLSIGEMVHYRDFAMSDGQPISLSSLCGLSSFAVWCRRKLTPEEVARMNVDEADRKAQAERDSWRETLTFVAEASADHYLYAATDQALQEETLRRELSALPALGSLRAAVLRLREIAGAGALLSPALLTEADTLTRHLLAALTPKDRPRST